MTRKYDLALLDLLKKREIKDNYKGATLRIKRVPDCDDEGCMDPRLYEDSKKMMRLLPFIPKSKLKMDTSKKGIENLRTTFNGIKSIPTVSIDIKTENFTVTASDGYQIPLYKYTQINTTEDSPVLY